MGEAAGRIRPATAVRHVERLRSALATAGLDLLSVADRGSGLIPASVAGQAMSVPRVKGHRIVTRDIDLPRLRDRANADWYELSVESGLFDPARPQCYVAVALDGEARGWARVQLRSEWDLMGAGAAGPLGSDWCRPEFVMLSLDQRVLVGGTTWQSRIGTIVVPEPAASPALRRAVLGLARSQDVSEEERTEARHWLELTAPGAGP